MRTARRLGFYLFGGLRLQHMSFTRRIANLIRAMSPLLSLDILAALVLLPAILIYGDWLVPVTSTYTVIRCLAPLTPFQACTTSIH
jgi:hypothetical protein